MDNMDTNKNTQNNNTNICSQKENVIIKELCTDISISTKDKSSFITVTDLPAIIKELGAYVPEEDLPSLMASLDPLHKGNVTLDDVLQWFHRTNANTDQRNNVSTHSRMDQYNKKAVDILMSKGLDAASEFMFKHPETGANIDYATMWYYYG
jgi:hypothetical protein